MKMNFSNSLKLLSGVGLGLLMQHAWAGNITGINVSTLSADQKVVKIRFDRDVVLPNGFNLSNPPRIALDFPGTGLSLPQNLLQYQDPLLRQISAASDASRTRIALDLTQSGQYSAEIKNGNEVWVYVHSAGAAAQPMPAATAAPRYQNSTDTATAAPSSATGANINFRKGSQNSGVIELTLPRSLGETQPKIKRLADRLILTYPHAAIAVADQKKLDVTDFTTPVKMVSLTRMGAGAELVLTMRGSWDYDIAGTGAKQTITIKPKNDVAEQGLGAGKPKKFSGGKVTLDFQDVDVRTILQILAKESGMNIVASDSVTGKMTLNLKDVPWDQALDLVMQARNLDMRKNGNIINIAPRAELLQKDKDILTAQNEIANSGPLSTRSYQLKYKSVDEFRNILNLPTGGGSTPTGNSILSSRGSALIDPSTNTLIITDNQFILEKFDKLIAELDVPARQVMIEARIVEAKEGFSRDLGVKFGYSRKPGNSGVSEIGGMGSGSFANPNVNLPAAAATSAITLVHHWATSALNLELTASQAESNSKIISSPRILTQDRKSATIQAGTDVPYQESSSSGATATAFKKAVLGLTVTPQITPDGNVIMNLNITNDSVDKNCNVNGTPCLNTQNLQTNAMVENGGTLIVGGIYQERDTSGEDKVPVLGDIPYVGNLFKKQAKDKSRNELLIFITPRIIDNVSSSMRY